jgi:hypothetical protein
MSYLDNFDNEFSNKYENFKNKNSYKYVLLNGDSNFM